MKLKLFRSKTPKPQTRVYTILTAPPKTIFNLPKIWGKNLKVLIKHIFFALTHNPKFLPYGGPQSVLASLERGLKVLGVPYKINPFKFNVSKIVGVVAGVDALDWAIKQKEKGEIETIVAGPNIVTIPADDNRIIKNPVINRVVVPSQWNKDWWASYDQYFQEHTTSWPAGVEDIGELRNLKGNCLIYIKDVSQEVYEPVIKALWEKKIPLKILHYGRFSPFQYRRALKKAKFMIYLSHVESQGIALHEAWMANVPTLIWSPGFFQIGDRRWEDPLISAPYFNSTCGKIFRSKTEFRSKLEEFLGEYKSYNPRKYSLDNFTDKIAADAYIGIIKNLS